MRRDMELAVLAQRNREALAGHAAQLHAMAATMRELDAATSEIASGAGRVAGAAERALEQVQVGERATAGIQEGLERIHENAAAVHAALGGLAGSIDRIVGAVQVIDDLADRADLLALNAALEGARAGEAGRGIQVIAAELRRLAENVNGRTSGIRELIGDVREGMATVLAASERNRDVAVDGEELGLAASVSLAKILRSVQETAGAAGEIRVATLQQREASAGALRSIDAMAEAGRQIEEVAEDLAEAAR